MEAQQSTLDLIEKFESFSSHAYSDIGGVLTIGFGFARKLPSGKKILPGETISLESSREELTLYVNYVILPKISLHCLGVLKQSKIDALCSLLFNVGNISERFWDSLRNNDTVSFSSSWLSYCHVNKIVVPGLLYRRHEELQLYLS